MYSLNYLQGSAVCGDFGEADDVAKVDGYCLVQLRGHLSGSQLELAKVPFPRSPSLSTHLLGLLQLHGDTGGQHLEEKGVTFAFLPLQLLGLLGEIDGVELNGGVTLTQNIC